jgi:SNF2 family DNA or RNA helicase
MALADKHRDYPFKTKPFKHQFDCWNVSKDLIEYAYFMEMGTGKSKVAVDNAAYLYDKGAIDGLLVIAPKAVYRTWYNDDDGILTGEIPTHMPDHVRYFATYWDAGAGNARIDTYRVMFKPSDKLHVLCMNVEALSTKGGKAELFAKKFLTTHKAIMIVDESTTIKNPKANRSASIIKLGGAAKYRRIASGFPVTRNPMDLYNQCLFLSWHLLGYSSIYAFRSRYALLQEIKLGPNRPSFKKIVGFQRIDELTDLLQKFSSRVLKEDCLDLPPKMYQYREVELTPEQRRHYDELRLMALTQLDGGVQVSAPQAMVRLGKLHEIVCGFMKDPRTGDVAPLPNNRLTTLLDTLDEVSGKAIIWACHDHDITSIYAAIVKEYGVEAVETFYGKTKDDRREWIKRVFQDPAHPLRFIVGNPATGRFGMTLTQAKTVIYYSNSHDLEHRIQSEDRAHRIGQTDPVLYVDLVTRGTVDERIIASLRTKKDIGEQVMGDGYREWLK